MFFYFKDFHENHRDYFLETFFIGKLKKMTCCFLSSRNKPAIEVIHKVHDIYSVPRIDIYFEGWYLNTIHLRPKDNSAWQYFLMIERTPSTLPQLFSFEGDESDIDTIH